MRTAESVVFTHWPPGPPARYTSTRRSFSLISTSTSSASGSTATVAVEVWMRPWLSVFGTRCTRCTPLSNFMTEYTWSPLTLNWISLKPPASEADMSIVSVFQPCALANRSYILYSSPAKMAASSPPAAARISTMMSLSSAGSAGISMNLISSSSAGSFASMPAISSNANSFMSGSASISLASSAACTYSRAFFARGPWLAYSLARRLYSF